MNGAPASALPALALMGVIGLIPALLLERRRRKSGIGERRYLWGYFQGMMGVLWSAVAAAGTISALGSGESQLVAVTAGGVLTLTWLAGGIGVLRRRRWGWVLHTVTSLNPVWWIANPLYVYRRWSELGTQQNSSFLTARVPAHTGGAGSRRLLSVTTAAQLAVVSAVVVGVTTFLMWQYATIPAEIERQERRAMNDIAEMRSDIVRWQQQSDSLSRDSSEALRADPTLTTVFVQELLAENRQQQQRLHLLLSATESQIHSRRMSIAHVADARARQRPRYAVAAFLLLLGLAAFAWRTLGST